jgi:hypothetical protein
MKDIIVQSNSAIFVGFNKSANRDVVKLPPNKDLRGLLQRLGDFRTVAFDGRVKGDDSRRFQRAQDER